VYWPIVVFILWIAVLILAGVFAVRRVLSGMRLFLHRLLLIVPFQACQRFRSHFKDLPSFSARYSSNHDHPVPAGDRTAAGQFFQAFPRLVGLIPFVHQMSRRDQERGFVGSRAYYWMKDLIMDWRNDSPTSDHAVYIADADWYMDMPAFLATTEAPVVMVYTITPEEACSEDPVPFTFMKDGSIFWDVHGGGEFNHLLWNYSTDLCSSWCWVLQWHFWIIPFLTPRFTSWYVDKRRLSRNRSMVCMTKAVSVTGWIMFTGFLSHDPPLTRFDPIDGDWIRFSVQGVSTVHRCYARPGTFAGAKVSVFEDDAIACKYRDIGSKLSSHHVRSILYPNETRISAEQGHIVNMLLEYHKECPYIPVPMPDRVSLGITEDMFTFSPLALDDPKPSMVAFMAPIIDGGLLQADTVADAKIIIHQRVKKFQKNEPGFKMTVAMHMYLEEFIRHVIPDDVANTFEPAHLDELFERQPRPSQQQLLELAAEYPAMSSMVFAFMKKEASQKIAEGRVISPLNAVDRMIACMFAYPFAAHCKNHTDCDNPGVWGGRRHPWYAFGRTPASQAQIIADMASEAEDGGCNGDYSRMDGTRVWFGVMVVMSLYTRAYKKQYVEDIYNLFRKTTRIPAILMDIMYTVFYATLSGDPITSVGTTSWSGFSSYYTHRRRGLSPAAAWQAIGLHAGDDTWNPNLPLADLTRYAAELGLIVKGVDTPRGSALVEFLNRIFPNPWAGDPNSCSNIVRAMSKFHLTNRLPGNPSPETILVTKARAYYLMDRNTPIIGEFVSKVLELAHYERIAEMRPDDARKVIPWSSAFTLDVQYPNYNEDFFAIFEPRLAAIGFDYPFFQQWVSTAQTVSELLVGGPFSLKTWEDQTASFDAHVGGDFVPGESSPPLALAEEALVDQEIPHECSDLHNGSFCADQSCKLLHLPLRARVATCSDWAKGECKRTVCAFSHSTVPAELAKPATAGIKAEAHRRRKLNKGKEEAVEPLELIEAESVADTTSVEVEDEWGVQLNMADDIATAADSGWVL
jgi:hypothetical protein